MTPHFPKADSGQVSLLTGPAFPSFQQTGSQLPAEVNQPGDPWAEREAEVSKTSLVSYNFIFSFTGSTGQAPKEEE